MAAALGVAVALGAGEFGLRVASRSEESVPEREPWGRWGDVPEPVGDCSGDVPQAALGQILRPSTTPDVVFELVASLDTCFRGARLLTDDRGLRIGEGSRREESEAYRVLLVGDSQAFGWGVPYEATVGARLEEAMRDEGAGPVEVLSAAVPGYNAYQEAALLEALASTHEPDCVVVLFTANDLALPFFLLRPETVTEPWSYLLATVRRATGSKRWFHHAESSLINFVTETDLDRVPEAYRHMVGGNAYVEALERMAEVASATGAPLINVASYEDLPGGGERYRSLQKELGVELLELSWPRGRRFQLSDEDPHPNPRGHKRFAGELFDALRVRSVCHPSSIGSAQAS